ncbi:hypothetical protein CCACVL1_25216 [Corchorus capsularis]|uniref:At1g61320/AtMIF1 LRR domain-containing protein n=1 Tax=Corchorus capsularis TaxID=210143 RepID=A0A1R3GLH0_COCAP|nr:hypothetical protein CCACVL1_25216 [Corchorus capsularis]
MEARDDDRISKLSDDILHVIVSLLSEKEGLRVRSLSRGWRYVPPPQVFNLCFDSETEYGKFIGRYNRQYHSKSKEFVTKVSQVLRNHRVKKFAKLHSLQVSFFHYDEYASEIDEWVSLAASMAVNKVEFKFADIFKIPPDENDPITHRFYRFPWARIISTRPNLDLEYLCLESCILKPVPPDLGLGLSSLKTLNLGYLVLDQDDFNKIASACLKLECLTLCRCTLPQTFCIGGGPGGTTLDHLKSLALDIHGGYPKIRKLIKIHDLVNLKNFECRGCGIDFSIRAFLPWRDVSSGVI